MGSPLSMRSAAHKRMTPDLRVSYDNAVRHITTALAGHPLYVNPALARRLAEQGLQGALTDRQRTALEKRGART